MFWLTTLFRGRLRVTDLTRTEAVQDALADWNGNAAPARAPLASAHLTGAAVDLSKVLSTRSRSSPQPRFHVMVFRAYAGHGARFRASIAIGGC